MMGHQSKLQISRYKIENKENENFKGLLGGGCGKDQYLQCWENGDMRTDLNGMFYQGFQD